MKTITLPHHFILRQNNGESTTHDLNSKFSRIYNYGVKSVYFIVAFISIFLLNPRSVYSQCTSAYQLDWSNPATYSVNCGTVVPAQWTVKRDSCNYWSPVINVGGMIGEPDKVVSITVRINQSGNLTNNDFAWVRFLVNGSLRKVKVVRGDTVSAVFSYTDTIHVPAGGFFQIHIALKTDLNTEFWQIKNGDISGCISSTGTLPVKMLYFDVIDNKSSALLKWSTGAELNNHFFKIQRSSNALEYEDIGIVKGAGNSSSIKHYTYNDIFPPSGTIYYRLVQIDTDGKETVYGPLAFKNKISKTDLVIYPNPVTNSNPVVTIESQNPLENVRIYNNGGKLLRELIILQSDTRHAEINIVDLQEGLYYISVINDGKIERAKLLIK